MAAEDESTKDTKGHEEEQIGERMQVGTKNLATEVTESTEESRRGKRTADGRPSVPLSVLSVTSVAKPVPESVRSKRRGRRRVFNERMARTVQRPGPDRVGGARGTCLVCGRGREA